MKKTQKKEVKKENKIFKYIVVAAVLIIPFMYSFFYLKAYWNPYGKGNIDNIPVAIVNDDKGDKGEELIDSIIDSEKLKITIVSEKKADKGLNDGNYYAVIKIPEDFTESMESASTVNKKHATITYSPNQKANYLASQIINSVVNAVEKNLDNSVNSAIVDNLSTKLNSVPDQLEIISDGFNKINDGTQKIENGAKELNDGIDSAYTGSKKILDSVNESITSTENKDAIDNTTLENIKNQAVNKVNYNFTDTYKDQIGKTAVASSISTIESSLIPYLSAYGIDNVESLCTIVLANPSLNAAANSACTLRDNLKNPASYEYSLVYKTAISSAQSAAQMTASSVSEQVAKEVAQTATNTTVQSLKTLSSGLEELTNGLDKLKNGSTELSDGAITLNNSIIEANNELNSKIDNTKEELKTLDGLSKYSKNPVNVKTKTVNEIESYGVAFAPLFISIALWVGCLMMFVVFYYDKKNRFKKLGMENNNFVERNLYYHITATITGIILGILLQWLLDLNITNILLYYISMVLVANMFMAIIQFLIVNFDDIGKFIALIILVLQLAASGGTFPIETVTSGFRWMHNILPMTYTIKLIRESIITIESSLLIKNLIIVIGIFITFFIITLICDILKQRKDNK